jgi:hypothetical protein
LTVRDLSLSETNGEPFLGFDRFYVNFQVSSLFRLAWTFDEISLEQPRGQVVLGKDGQFNFANLFSSPTNSQASKKPPATNIPAILIFNLTLTNGHLAFADLSRKTPFHATYEPMNLHLTKFTTQPHGQSPYSFAASSDSERRLVWAGTVTAQPLASSGTVQISGIQVPKHSPYLEDVTRVKISDGALDVTGSYAFLAGTNGVSLLVSNLTVKLAKLELKDPETSETVAAMPSVELRGGTIDSDAHQAHVELIQLASPELLIRRNRDGSINIPSLILRRTVESAAQSVAKPPFTNAPPKAPWIFTLDDYQLQNGVIRFEDATLPEPFRSRFQPVTIRVQHFSNATNAETAVHTEATTEDNEKLTLNASYAVNPSRGQSDLKLEAVDLKRYRPYFDPYFRGVVTDGKANLALKLSHEFQGDALQMVVTNATLQVADLQIQSPDQNETVFSAPTFTIENFSENLLSKAIRVAKLASKGAALSAQRATNGTINLSLLVPRSTNSTPAPNPPAAETNGNWSFALDEVALQDWALHVVDQQIPKPGKLDLDHLTLTLRGTQFPSNSPVAVDLSTRVNGAGSLAVRGTVRPYSPGGNADVSLAGLELRPFQPWIEPHVHLGIEGGTFSTTGRVEFTSPDNHGPKVHCTGKLAVDDLETIDQVVFKDLVRWKTLAVDGINLDIEPSKASIEQITLAGLKTTVILDPSHQMNILSVLPARDSNTPPATVASSESSTNAFPFDLNTLKLDKVSLHFQDQTVEPPCNFALAELSGTVRGLSTKTDSAAEVAVAGKVDEASPFGVSGTVNPLAHALALNLTFTNSNLQLTPFTPYLEKYVGHPLKKGRMSLDLGYYIQTRNLKAHNKVQIDQLVLGPRVENSTATKLPVKLAVALLKDSSGRIDLDLPVEGRLDDPQFSLGPVILKIIGNLIVKAAASPFKLIGALVGGGEELSIVEFDPGQARVLDSETNKLNKLVHALEKRPALNLEIEGSFDPVSDREALARGMVRNQVKLQRLQELSSSGQTPASSENFQLQPTEYERLLRAQIAKTLGANLTAAIRAAAERAAAAATNTTTSPGRLDTGPGFFSRMASLFKGGKERAATREAHRAAKADALLLEQNPELGRLSAHDMEGILASQTEVPPDDLRQLMEERAKAVQAYFISPGQVAADRLFLVTPKTPDASFQGDARAHLSLN